MYFKGEKIPDNIDEINILGEINISNKLGKKN